MSAADRNSITINQTTGLISGAIKFSGNIDTLNISGGTINGDIVAAGTGSDIVNFNLAAGNTFTYNSNFSGSGATVNVNSGTVVLNGIDYAAFVTVAGGVLAGSGTIDSVVVRNGGTLAPGTPGVAGSVMSIAGGLTFTNGAAVYLDTISGTNASKTAVTGSALLRDASVQISTGSTVTAGIKYTILTDTAYDLGGTNIFNPNVSYGSFRGTLSYDPSGDDVYLTFAPSSLAALLPFGAPANEMAVASAIDNYTSGGGTLPAGFSNLLDLSGAQLEAALGKLDGEASTGAQIGAFTLMTEFLQLMLGEGGGGSSNIGSGLGFASNEQTELPPDIASAYDGILKGQPKQTLDQRWSVWASGFGGTSITDGNAAIGSSTVTATTYGTAAGMEYRPDPNTRFGLALAGAGLNWTLAQEIGSGRSESFQAGLYGSARFGPAYFAVAVAAANHWMTVTRSAPLGDQLTASFMAQSYGARLEGGYRSAVLPSLGVTPYGAFQAQAFLTPSYSEMDFSGGGLGLSYAATDATDLRSELGVGFDEHIMFNSMPLVLRERAAWAHDWISPPSLLAVFQSLPGANFIVNGASLPANSALTTATAEFKLNTRWSVEAKFDGEMASAGQMYAGTGTLRYTW